MADRFPLIVDSSTQRVKELPSADNLDLTGSGIVNVKNITLPDSSDSTDGRLKFGASTDMMLYHFGGANYFDVTNTLNIRGGSGATINIKPKNDEEGIIITPDGSVKLYYDNSSKFETTSGGASVTGTFAASTRININNTTTTASDIVHSINTGGSLTTTQRTKADGTIQLGSVNGGSDTANIVLNAAGTASFVGRVDAGSSTLDNAAVVGSANHATKGVFQAYHYNNGSVWVAGGADGVTKSEITAAGAASFAGGAFAIDSDGEITTNVKSAGHIELDSTGTFSSPKIKLYANTGFAEFTGEIKVEGSNTPSGLYSGISKYGSLLIATSSESVGDARLAIDSGNGNITSAGSATFDGDVTVGGYNGSSTTTDGVLLGSVGGVYSQLAAATAATGVVFQGMHGSSATTVIKANGSATFNNTVAAASFFGDATGTSQVWYGGSSGTSIIKADGTAQFAAGNINLNKVSNGANLNVRNDASSAEAAIEVYKGGFTTSDRTVLITNNGAATFAGNVSLTSARLEVGSSSSNNAYVGNVSTGGSAYDFSLLNSSGSVLYGVKTDGSAVFGNPSGGGSGTGGMQFTSTNGQLDLINTNSGSLITGYNRSSTSQVFSVGATGDVICASNTIDLVTSSGHGEIRVRNSGGSITAYINGNAGSANFSGAVSKGSGSFRIDHPLKPETHKLVHSFVEGPQADNIYRGKVELVDGTATVNIDTVAGMTEGTFAALNREIQCFTTNETGWTAIKGSVTGNLLTIVAQDDTCTDTISWLVIGERQDQHMYDTEWTDENGKVIVEPEKS